MFERGYHGTSLRDVAKVVGVQMSSLYYYYPGKQALLVDVMRTTLTDLIAEVGAAIDGAPDPRAKLIAGMRAHIMFHAERRKENVIADSEIRSLEPEQRPAIIALRDAYERLFADVLEDGRRTGAFELADVRVALAALLAMTNGVATWYRPRGRLALTTVADQYCGILLGGIGAP
jgi:AcrR family transcriptional regulator